MWYAFWLFCGLYPGIYLLFAPFSLLTFFLCWIIIFAWDYTNYLEYKKSE